MKRVTNALAAAALLSVAAITSNPVPHTTYQRPPKARRTKDQRAKAKQSRKARKSNKGRK